MNFKKVKLAIAFNPNEIPHSGSWVTPWVDYCRLSKIDYQLVDFTCPSLISQIREFSGLLWHLSGYNYIHSLMAKSVLYSAKVMGLKIFPDFSEAWHFDDKIAQSYLLDSVRAPMPQYNVFYSLQDAFAWIDNNESFPLVGKLRNGSGSHNVKLIVSKQDARRYVRKMFREGFSSSPSLVFKASSNLASSRNLNVFIDRIKKVPEFLRTRCKSKSFPRESKYVFFQEFIPNNGFDLKVVVVGDKLSFVARNVRKGDFRASGGGDLYYDRALINQNLIRAAFTINEKLGFQCMGYDFVTDKHTGLSKIVEMSFGFSHFALLQAGGHFDRSGSWHDEPLNAPAEVLNNILK